MEVVLFALSLCLLFTLRQNVNDVGLYFCPLLLSFIVNGFLRVNVKFLLYIFFLIKGDMHPFH